MVTFRDKSSWSHQNTQSLINDPSLQPLVLVTNTVLLVLITYILSFSLVDECNKFACGLKLKLCSFLIIKILSIILVDIMYLRKYFFLSLSVFIGANVEVPVVLLAISVPITYRLNRLSVIVRLSTSIGISAPMRLLAPIRHSAHGSRILFSSRSSSDSRSLSGSQSCIGPILNPALGFHPAFSFHPALSPYIQLRPYPDFGPDPALDYHLAVCLYPALGPYPALG